MSAHVICPYIGADGRQAYSIVVIHGDVANDLNAGGDTCTSIPELASFIREAHAQGAYSSTVRDALLEQAGDLHGQ